MGTLENSVIVSVVAILFSGIAGVIISRLLHQKYEERSIKRDVLRRFVGNRYILTEQHKGQGGELFVAMNEIFIVYAGDGKVIDALKKMHEELNRPERMSSNLITLTKAMASAAKVSLHEFNDDFILTPFSPRRGQ